MPAVADSHMYSSANGNSDKRLDKHSEIPLKYSN